MRADRLFSIVLLLQSRGQMTARALARELEVSERTIHRDMEALSGAGIPVIAERGSTGGWALLGEYRTNLTGLNEAEIQSLFVTRPSAVLADLRLDKAAEGALLKLLAALPSIYRRGAEHTRQRIHIDVTGWHTTKEAVPLLHVIQNAIWKERQLRIRYQRGECDSVQRLVEPLGLVAKGSVWYLVGSVEGQVRSYRVSRVLDAEMTEKHFERPANFDLVRFWEHSAVQFRELLPRYQTKVRVRPEIVSRMPYAGRFCRIEEMGQPDADGWIPVTLRFDIEEMACEYALGFGAQLEVLEPPALRDKVIAAAKATLESYNRS